ncbi:Initiation factor 2B related protein [mine drainage metagenome]|uniref:Initiation factor 2B related protein n=1 Tax=mine drainage metagenome TaxID=410659 RepID=T1CGC7_9ZZZZ
MQKKIGIPFYVAAPGSTFDFSLKTGNSIPIEERGEEEVLCIGDRRLAPESSHSRNPAFDVTPSKYVTAFITEYGLFDPSNLKALKARIDADLFMR